MQIKDFIPPILYKIAHKLKGAEGAAYLPEYATFTEALNDCSGYNDADIANIVLHKTKKHIANLNQTVRDRLTSQNILVIHSILNLENLKHISVLEIGGACGALFHTINHHFPEKIERWLIVETNEMVRTAKEYSGNSKLFFENNVNLYISNRKDLCIMQGALQYIEEPELFFKNILNVGFKFIYISRTPFLLNASSSVISIGTTLLWDHGPGKIDSINLPNKTISVPITYLPYQWMIEEIQNNNYCIEYEFMEYQPQLFNFIKKRNIAIQDFGFLLRLKNTR